MKQLSFLSLSLVLLMTVSCSSTKKLASPQQPVVSKISSLKLLGQYEIPYNLTFKKTTVGGLSGIDYDAANELYYMVCDDRSNINPARFYTAKIFISAAGIDSFRFVDMQPMLQANGQVYPTKLFRPFATVDPEAMRYDPLNSQLVWSSEGERIVSVEDTIVQDPAIYVVSRDGYYVGSYNLPANLKMNSFEKGPRQNGVFEGMTFADNYKTLFVNVEEPLYEDGPRVDVKDQDTYIRILKFDTETKNNIAQYAYKPDAVAYPAVPEDGYKINGIPDLLSIGPDRFIVIERSYSTGRLACTIKIFLTDFSGATDIRHIASLSTDKNFVPASKKLLLNMDDLGIYVDNVEGVTLGPVLPNGHRSLIFIADNNFNAEEKSQVFLFEIE
ncbi:esterase-like activity of phytase family protein [Ferruginibacter sp. HRS2-29]|uniref:esterase-like activity of phytase family protein n=1 Tax=Ferruginibacter sp. HRS2-29 TaxID=2487334 RepID=UPI0020CCF1A1|nr:esterase-like activity of phytase family protein [Ferruginibacter sp. HRS2-29]MCP9750019.1 esterase-like activity of phytase family protein [Ferruginibacter sp. HRS2-29]